MSRTDVTSYGRSSDWGSVHAVVAGIGVAGFACADQLVHLGARVTVVDSGDGARQRERAPITELTNTTADDSVHAQIWPLPGSTPIRYGAQVQVSWMPARRASAMTRSWNARICGVISILSSCMQTRATWVAVGTLTGSASACSISRTIQVYNGCPSWPAGMTMGPIVEQCTLSTATSRRASIASPQSTSRRRWAATRGPSAPSS